MKTPIVFVSMFALFLATGCSRTMVTNAMTPNIEACLVFVPITWSAKDTKDTILLIKQHNAVHKDFCSLK